MNDHTDGHVDNLARFVGEGRLAIPEPGDRRSQRRRLCDARQPRATLRARGRAACPRPAGCVRGGEIIPASYMNFYIGNAAVVVPQSWRGQ